LSCSTAARRRPRRGKRWQDSSIRRRQRAGIFSIADEVAALVRAYQTQPEPVTVTFRLLDEGLRKVSDAKVALPPAAFPAGAPADARYALPLRKLKPGIYVLRVAAARRGGQRAARRT
jgi:hypothetical protein